MSKKSKVSEPILPRSFYLRKNTLQIAKDLLGKIVNTTFDNRVTSGIIVETEAYLAPEDQASHAKNYRRTPRTESFYKIGGTAYVYISYGVHHLFNVVTGPIEFPHAILIRAIEPLVGLDIMFERRNMNKNNNSLTGGPGRLGVALGINVSHDAIDLCNPESDIQILNNRIDFKKNDIGISPRIGIDPVGEPWASKPYRFFVKENKWLSR